MHIIYIYISRQESWIAPNHTLAPPPSHDGQRYIQHQGFEKALASQGPLVTVPTMGGTSNFGVDISIYVSLRIYILVWCDMLHISPWHGHAWNAMNTWAPVFCSINLDLPVHVPGDLPIESETRCIQLTSKKVDTIVGRTWIQRKLGHRERHFLNIGSHGWFCEPSKNITKQSFDWGVVRFTLITNCVFMFRPRHHGNHEKSHINITDLVIQPLLDPYDQGFILISACRWLRSLFTAGWQPCSRFDHMTPKDFQNITVPRGLNIWGWKPPIKWFGI